MMGDKRERQQLASEASQESIVNGLNGHTPSELEAMGSKKRRPTSPEVVVHARPRTPSQNESPSFEQSQSPSKKQRTESKSYGIEERLVGSSIFASSRHSEASTSKRSGSVIAGEHSRITTYSDLPLLTFVYI